MERPPRKPDEWERGAALGQAGEVLGVGLQFAAAIVVFLFAGWWLDGVLGTRPLLLIVGVFVGAGAGFYSMYRQLVVRPRDRSERKTDRP